MARLAGRYALLLAALVCLNFALPRLLPGDPLDASGSGQDPAAPLPAQAEAQLRAYYHLDQSGPLQFASYIQDLARGDLGWSISRGRPVGQLVAERLPWTVALVATAVVLAALVGLVAGALAGWHGGRLDRLVTVLGTSLAALPEVLLALGLLLVFGISLGWLPIQGGLSLFAPAGSAWAQAIDGARHLLLPGLALMLSSAGSFVLLARGGFRRAAIEPYVVAARARGLNEPRVLVGQAAPNAVVPVLAYGSLRLGQVVAGAIVVERVFSLPGVGLLATQAIQARDYPVLQGVFLLTGTAVLVVNFLTDVALARRRRRLGPA